jgi:pimeloyl-ACP methyl ester carboxylesterase
MRRRHGALLAAAGLVVAACSTGGNDHAAEPSGEPSTSSTADVTTSSGVASTETAADVTTSSGVASTEAAADAPGSTDAGATPTTRERNCPGDAPPEATCSWVDVPADWSASDGQTITLPVTVLAASSDDPRADPIVIPAGGPGFSAAQDYGWTGAPHNEAHDIVLYDQRGTGLAQPTLRCPEVDEVKVANLQRSEPYDVELEAVLVATAACRQRLTATGVDFDDYDTEASVRDLDAIRTALGYDEWNILGISYGARLALAAMRSTPDGVRAAVLDSVSDVTGGGIAAQVESAERAYGVLADACAADSGCAARHGELRVVIDDVYEQWETDPVEVEVDLGHGAGTQRFVLTGSDMLAGLYNAMYDATLIPMLPSVVSAFAAGDTTLVAELVRSGVRALTGAADAMSLSVNCADYGSMDQSADRAIRADPGRQALLALALLCEEWPVEPAAPAFNEPVDSHIPALVLAGVFDPVTPPEATAAVADSLQNATFLLFPDRAHGVIGPGADCAEAISIAFLADPQALLDTSCVADVSPPKFN